MLIMVSEFIAKIYILKSKVESEYEQEINF